MKDSLKSKLKKSDLVFAVYAWRHYKDDLTDDKNFYKVLRAAYDRESSSNMLVMHHYGDKLPERVVYNITTRDPRGSAGLGAELHHVLYGLRFSDLLGACPRVMWGSNFIYHDPGMDKVTDNVFDYYFEPISDLSKEALTDFRNVITYSESHAKVFHDMQKLSYAITDSDIAVLADQYAKSIHPNAATRKFIDEGVSRAVGEKRMLGVHVRGTDFNVGLRNHPKIVAKEDYLSAVKAEFNRGGGGAVRRRVPRHGRPLGDLDVPRGVRG